jgi:hypothetical protein
LLETPADVARGGEAPSTIPARSEPAAPSLPVPSETPREGTPTAGTTVLTPEGEIRGILRRYQAAYETLDAGAAAEVWPGVDRRALARAFEGLRSQRIEFERCEVNAASGATTAVATCAGRATYVPAVGRAEPRTQARRWRFTFRLTADGWRIEQAQIWD